MEKEQMKKTQLKYLGPIYLYNMLQDFRHLLIIDFRKEHQQCHIRDSLGAFEISNQKIVQVIEIANKKAVEKQQKYPTIKKIRRYFFIANEKLETKDQRITKILQIFNKFSLFDKEDKFYILSEPFSVFFNIYGFMCIQSKKLEGVAGINERQRILLYPYSKFPAQILAGKVFLGNIYNSNSQIQLKDLGINALFDFIEYGPEQKVPEFKQSSAFLYFNLPFNREILTDINFEWINSQIDKLIAQKQNKILLYCKDGESVSAAFAISYLMYKCGLDVTMATLKICQTISRVQIDKKIYSQLLLYKPLKKI